MNKNQKFGIKDLIAMKLKTCPSYFKWSAERIADYFSWNPKTVKAVMLSLKDESKKYRNRTS